VRQVVEGRQEVFEREYPCHSPDRKRWFLLRAAPLEPPGTGAVVAHIDVTARRKSISALQRAKEQAEEATRLKTSLLANMNHEVRTPLTAVIGFSELLVEELEGTYAQFAERIYQSSQRLLQTLDSVLQLSTLNAGVREGEVSTVPLCITVQQTVRMLRSEAQRAGVHLDVSLPPNPVVGRVDENAVHRILLNLIENAIKFTDSGGKIEVSVRQEGDAAVLTVADTGVGMSAEFLPHALEPFQQESTGLNRAYEGIGLGLAITRHLVDVLGGTIDVESQKDRGTRCSVRLPL
jgi:signal transduction histidine kinase